MAYEIVLVAEAIDDPGSSVRKCVPGFETISRRALATQTASVAECPKLAPPRPAS